MFFTNRFDVERFKKLELEARHQQLQKELAEADSRTANLDEFITTNSNKLATLRERSHELSEKVIVEEGSVHSICSIAFRFVLLAWTTAVHDYCMDYCVLQSMITGIWYMRSEL